MESVYDSGVPEERPSTSNKISTKRKIFQSNEKATGEGKKSKKWLQYYNKMWELKFSWVQPCNLGRTYFTCKYCPKPYCCGNDGITALKAHEKTMKHNNAAKCMRGIQNISAASKKTGDLEKVAMFIRQKNLPIAIADDLMDFIKNTDFDKDTRPKETCDRTECTALIQNVIVKCNFENIVSVLQEKLFSLIIDESTDIQSKNHLVLCVRVADDDDVRDEFLGLLQVQDGTHEALYKSIVKFFEENNIPYRRNMVGFASDGTSVMFAVNNSVATKFKKDIPNLFTMKCICHSLARAVSYAVQELPDEIEELLSDTFCYLKHSSNRRIALGEFQVLNEISEEQLKKSIKVKWLSLSSVVNRFIEQYDALFKFFEAESKENNADAKRIFDRLKVRWTILYLYFLNFVLPLGCKRNEVFQAEKPKIHLLHRKMETLFKTVVSLYLNEDYINRADSEFIEFAEITKDNERNWKPLHKVNLGPLVTADLACLPPSISVTEINVFRSKCRQLLITLAKEIYKRFPFMERSVKLLKQLGFIEPEILKETQNISEVADFFGFDVQEVHLEFKKMKKMFTHDMDKDGLTFWQKVRAVKFDDGSAEFPLILQIIERVNVLPHSSANCERMFNLSNQSE